MPVPDPEKRLARRLKLRDLHILAAVVQWGSMAKAAPHLAMTQPAVSESIANLEDALRVRLLDRSPHGVTPTIYGQALLRRGEVVFDELRQGVKELEFLANPEAGEVRVAAGDTAAAGLLPAVIERLTRQHPQIVIRVVQASAETTDFRELRTRAVDIALARVPRTFKEPDLDTEILFDDPHRVVVGVNSPWTSRRKVKLADLMDEPWLFASNQVIGELIAEAFKLQGLQRPQGRVIGSSILLRNQLLATGRFVTVLPQSVMQFNAKQWGLRALPIDLGVKLRSVAVIKLANRTLTPVVERFVETVREVARTLSKPAKAYACRS